ncbi:hypothetical protein P389DRAFT_174114 [Cystobasidium minutum MCA 4210]|uniref:uncharacterized protein n=1 Tax=Cystobasidium minutum MCA 4210 TaxID=1397322 RepID=UPI0034CD7A3C|eukprot:jgi/Rhomi1/174114/fgenesh1_kg.7_\
MKLTSSLITAWSSALLLCCSKVNPVSAATTTTTEQLTARQSKFHSLADKNSGIVHLTSALYDELIQDTPSNTRDYSVSIILTALNPKYGCQPCMQFDKEHKELARQWWNRKENKKDRVKQMRHVFAVLDFEKGQEIFKRLGLSTAPLGQLFLPNSAQPIQYEFNKFGLLAEPFASFLSTHTGHPISFTRPVDYSRLASIISVLVAVITASIFFWRYVKVFVTSRWVWAVGSLLFILPNISGYMWVQIRKPPPMQVGPKGQINYIASGFSNQFGVEYQIMSVVYGILAFSAYTIAVTVPSMSHDTVRQRVGAYLWIGVMVIMASILVSIFHIKNPGYPFKLLI